MNGQSYLLEIYDADSDEFTGPNPILMKGCGVINGPENTQYFVLEAEQDVFSNGTNINQLAVRAHYNGDTIDKLLDSVTTVGIALLKDDVDVNESKKYGFDDFIFWKVGKIKPRTNGVSKG